MKKHFRNAPYLLILLVTPLLSFIYQLLNEHPRKSVEISTSIDQFIPFVPAFIIPYLLWYVYMLGYLIYFCFKDTRVYIQTLIIIAAGEVVCFIIYFFFQTTVPRPELTGNSMLIQLVRYIYVNDEPYNCFPSIHVLTTFAVMLGSIHLKNKHLLNTFSIHFGGTLIIISTLFVKQHVVFDMIGSMFLVTFLYGIIFEPYQVRMAEKTETVYVKNKG